MTIRARWIMVALLLNAGCGAPPVRSLAVGGRCYSMDWSALDSSLSFVTPDAVRFEMDSVGLSPEGTVERRLEWAFGPDTITRVPGSTLPWHRRLYNRWWQGVGADSVRLDILDNGNMHWIIIVRGDVDHLEGLGEYRTHAGFATTAVVRMVPIQCSHEEAAA